jgi:hypothetical protein
MSRAVITIHLPAHRRASLKAYGESPRLIGEVYDRYIGRYVKYLRETARQQGFRVRTDSQDTGAVYQIDERNHRDKKAAHSWLTAVPDVWEWIT